MVVWQVQTMWKKKWGKCTEKEVLVKKKFIAGLKMFVSKRCSAKEKVPSAAVRKEGHAERTLKNDLLEKRQLKTMFLIL